MIETLMQINRSITGDGVRSSLELLRERSNFDVHEVPTGTKVFDWTIPQEWVIRDAVLTDERDKVWADYKKNFLHIVSYSEPKDELLSYDQLKIYTAQGAIPYRTSYYNRDWGFCLKEEVYRRMDPKNKYHVKIDSEFKDGSLTYGEMVKEGDEQEYIISTYCCHPNMINDNVAGMVMWSDLLRDIGKTKHTYRFVIAPETIGMITYLATHDVSKVKGAIVLSHTVGDGEVGFKCSFQGNSYMDRVARQVLKTEQPFSVRGSDERQLSSPAFRIPTIVVNRGGLYTNNYHTSKDNIFNYARYEETLNSVKEIIHLIESDKVIKNYYPHCEPMLGKRNLYPTVGGENHKDIYGDAHLVNLFYSGLTILEIAEKTGMSMNELVYSASLLKKEGLIA